MIIFKVFFLLVDNEESQEKKLENGVVPGPGIDLEFETDGKVTSHYLILTWAYLKGVSSLTSHHSAHLAYKCTEVAIKH